MSREAMQMALEALESDPISHTGLVNRKQAITALRQALVDADDISEKRVEEKAKREHEWVGLTSDDIHYAFCHAEYDANQDWNDDPEGWCKAFANYVEAKLKGNNQ
jgi:hypothetical protein